MSFNEWESGTITLPTAAVPGLRQALNAAITDPSADDLALTAQGIGRG
ncbi:hypothetical protein SIM91_05700 [Rhodococcus opacus]|nr:hypothetical protein [Rhodococcus opacus]MDX5962808.1 hypothetical protein [Rhodococcus opacus]CAG7637655.1 hypothetical protein E143388_07916 [Rhodococcus opacus]